MRAIAQRVWQVPARRYAAAGRGASARHTYQMKVPWTDPSLRELLALAALAAFGCGFALARGDFLFVAIFAAACAITIIERYDVRAEMLSNS